MKRSIFDVVKALIAKRKARLQAEIKEWQRKMHDTESYWGFNGPYKRQEAALNKREKELEEIEEFERQLSSYTPYEEISLYSLYCRNCGNVVFSSQYPMGNYHECPNCKKMIYDNNPERKTFRIENDGQLWIRAFKESKRNECD